MRSPSTHPDRRDVEPVFRLLASTPLSMALIGSAVFAMTFCALAFGVPS